MKLGGVYFPETSAEKIQKFGMKYRIKRYPAMIREIVKRYFILMEQGVIWPICGRCGKKMELDITTTFSGDHIVSWVCPKCMRKMPFEDAFGEVERRLKVSVKVLEGR